MSDKYCTKHGEPAYEPCECIDFCEEEAANAASAAEIARLSKECDELRDFIRSIHEGPWASMMSAAANVPKGARSHDATVAFPINIMRDWDELISAKLANTEQS